MAARDLTPYREVFQAEVLKHIHGRLAPDEWTRFRTMAANKKNWPPGPQDKVDPDITPEAFVELSTNESPGMSLNELFVVFPNHHAIGSIDGSPIYYIDASGIYIWSPTSDAPVYLDLWLTYPAYPPGW